MADARTSTETRNPKENATKKPFNKKKWREEKYSTKVKVQKWQEKRKIVMRKKLDKQLKKEGIDVSQSTTKPENKRDSRIKEAQMQYERVKEDRRNAAAEAKKTKEEKMKKIKEHKTKKMEKLRILSQKTRKGQPLMKGRLELLQQKIEKMVAENRL